MSFPTAAQIDNLLMKKNQLVPFTSTSLSSSAEATGSSAVKSISSNVWAQKIPNASPFSILDLVPGQAVGLQTKSDGTALIPGGGGYTVTKSLLATGGYKYVNNDPLSSFVVYYEKVVLASTTPNMAFRYAGTDTAIGVLETNILISGIPTGYDPANGTYKVQVYNSAASNAAMSGTVSDYPWIYDGTSGYLTFYQSLLSYPGGTAIPVISFWRYEGATLQDKLIAIDASIATAGSGGSGGTGSDPSFQQWIVDPPKPIVFPTPNVLNTPTSQKIYIPWDYPQQFSIGLVATMVPNITSLSVQWTAKMSASPFYKSSQAIITNDTDRVRYLSTGLSGTDGLNTTAVTGLILTNVSQATTYASVVWPDGITRWSCTFYSADFASLTCTTPGVADPSNVITAWYNNYNPNSGVTNKSTQSFKIFLVAGPPSPPAAPTFTATASQTASTTAAGTGISGTMTRGSVGTYTDSVNSNNIPTISNWKYTGTGIASATRWTNGGTYTALTPAAITSAEIATGTTSALVSLYPDTIYTFYDYLKNNANANYSTTSTALSVTTTNIAPIKAMPTSISLSTTPTTTTAKLVAANDDSPSIAKDTILSVWFGTLTTISTSSFSAPIHYAASRGKLTTADSTRLLDITSNVTRSGMTTQTGETCKYTSFPIAAATGGVVTNGIAITSASSVDSFTTNYLTGYYLETGANSVTITGTTIWAASPKKTYINVNLQQYQLDGTTANGTATSLSTSFYYDPYSTAPSIDSFSATLRSMSAPTKISGVEIITGAIGLTGVTNVLNIGRYFYVSGAIITYSTGQTETTLGNTTNIALGGTLDASCIFTNATLSVAAPTTYTTSISVNASSVKNCVGTSVASGTTAVPFNMLFDPLSITLAADTTKYPTSFPITAGAAGTRVYSGKSNASGSTALQTRFIPTFPNAIILTAYDNSVVINDATNYPNYSEDLQLFNGLIRTKGTTTQGYANYSTNKISISANSTLTYANIDNAGYRYATFAWLCPTTAGTYSKITFTMHNVNSTITGVTTEQPQVDGSNIYMFYRLQEGGTGNTGSIATSGNANTYWINAFGSSTSVSNTNIYVNSNPTSLGGDDTSLPSTFSGTTLTMYCVIPSFVVSNAVLGNAASRIMYFRVGLPMAKDIGFEYITASFS